MPGVKAVIAIIPQNKTMVVRHNKWPCMLIGLF